MRRWKYNTSVDEYFVEDETTTVLRLRETHAETKETDNGDLCLQSWSHGRMMAALNQVDIGECVYHMSCIYISQEKA